MKRSLSLLLSGATILSLFAVSAVPTSAQESEKLSGSKTAEIIATHEKVAVDISSVTSTNSEINGRDPKKLFDGDVRNKLEGFVSSKDTVSWALTEAATLKYYVVYTGNDTSNYGERNPESWVLYASNDNATWTVIDTVTTPGMKATDLQGYGYEIDNPGSYKYYRYEFTNDNSYFQLGEMELYTDKVVGSASTADDPTNGRYEVKCNSFDGGTDHGFIDGNFYLAIGISELFGETDNTKVLDQIKIYIGGKQAKLNKTYKGYTHCGRNGGDGLFYGIVSGGFKANEENEVIILLGDSFYSKASFTPKENTVAVLNSDTTYFTKLNSCVSVVTFAETPAYKEGDTITSEIHDDHNKRTFTVTKVEDKTVTFVCDNFSTSYTLLEMDKANDTRFSIPIDHENNMATTTSVGYFQTRDNPTDSNAYDLRLIVEGNQDYLTSYDSAKITATFTLSDGSTRVISPDSSATVAYAKVNAAGVDYTATNDCALFGFVVTKIPFGVTKSVQVTVTYSKDGEADTVVDLGTAALVVTTKASLGDVMAMNKVAADQITVTAENNTGRDINDGEGAAKLFDGTTAKMGSHNSEFSISFNTTNPTTISGLIFTVGNDSNSNKRTFKSWAIYGVDADGNEILVASSDQSVTIGVENYDSGSTTNPEDVKDGNREAYIVKNAGEFTNYIIRIVGAGGYNQMGELTLYTK